MLYMGMWSDLKGFYSFFFMNLVQYVYIDKL